MKTIDYSKYTYTQLLEAERAIDRNKYPENYQALILELEIKQKEYEADQDSQRISDVEKVRKRVLLVGYFQLITTVVFPLFVALALLGDLVFHYSIALIVIGVVVINAVAAYGILKNILVLYWVSVFNLSLQLFSFTLSHLHFNYSGLGGVYLSVYWLEGVKLGFKAALKPAFSARYFAEPVKGGFISLDVLAVVLLIAIFTVLNEKRKSSSLAQY